MKKIIFALLSLFIVVVIVRWCKPPQKSEVEEAALKLISYKLVVIPDSLKTRPTIVDVLEYHDYVTGFAKDFLKFYPNIETASLDETKKILLENWGCLFMSLNVVGFRVLGLNMLDDERVNSVLDGNKIESLINEDKPIDALNAIGKEHEDALHPERFKKYFDFYLYILEEANKKLNEIIK